MRVSKEVTSSRDRSVTMYRRERCIRLMAHNKEKACCRSDEDIGREQWDRVWTVMGVWPNGCTSCW